MQRSISVASLPCPCCGATEAQRCHFTSPINRTNAFIAQAVLDAVRSACDAEDRCELVGIHCVSETIYAASFADRRPNHESAALFHCEIWILPGSTHLSVQEYLESFIADYFSSDPVWCASEVPSVRPGPAISLELALQLELPIHQRLLIGERLDALRAVGLADDQLVRAR
jgi:hypothetical protein